jgi:hypothetical protein
MGKGTTKGRYICKVGFYDIYASDSMRKKAGRGNLTEVASTVYNIYHSKKLVDKGFKTKDIAVERAKELTTK